jgi:tRNA pseudouridine38-40 synthase
MNYKLYISYDGTNFSGWQIQPNVRTIQQDLQVAIQEIFKNNSIKLYGSGRTDSGVHAYGQIANFSISTTMDVNQIIKAVNSKINRDIYVYKCRIVEEDFNSRFSAVNREYIYKINTSYNPFERNYSWYVSYDLDLNKLHECASYLLGNHDFKLFCKSLSLKDKNNCIINKSYWTIDGNYLLYNISANRFLHHMVRMLVGTMIEVSKGNLSIDVFHKMVRAENLKSHIVTCPANGLYLNKVNY